MWSKSITTLNPYEATRESLEQEAVRTLSSESSEEKDV